MPATKANTASKVLTQTDRRTRRNDMAKAVKSGTPVAKVARKYEVTIKTVQSACREFGVAFEGMTSAAA